MKTRSAYVPLTYVALAACATQSTGKPLLTERVFKRLLVTCHAESGKFIPGKRGLPPHFKVTSGRGEIATDDKPTPTVDCMDKGVKPYRYDYYNVLDDDAPSAP